MTIETYNLTEHTQLSIRGRTGSHPDSEFVFGIYMDETCLENAVLLESSTKASYAYDDMDWDDAVEMAHWILDTDRKFKKRDENE